MDIYSFPTFNLTKILLTAEEANTPYTLHLLNAEKAEHKTSEHLARQPLGKVPAIVLNDQAYFESNAICRLIADKYAPALYGKTPEQRALTNQWIDFMALHAGRWLATVLFEEVIGPVFFKSETNKKALTEAIHFLSEQLPVLDKQLQKQPYLTGNLLSVADLVAFSYFETITYCSTDISAYTAICEWLDNIKARNSYRQAMSKLPGNATFATLLNSR